MISGPISVDFCNQAQLWMAEGFDIMYSSCRLQSTGRFDINGMKTALYQLKLKKILYTMDANSYITQVTKMIDAFNRPFPNCPFNGFIFLS
ncbi:unnamed protein product [Dicrocoelium dendriticum]|nr:unnamed protein product [Dicrocoelium dendriticum]